MLLWIFVNTALEQPFCMHTSLHINSKVILTECTSARFLINLTSHFSSHKSSSLSIHILSTCH